MRMVFARSHYYNSTPAIPRALEAGRGIFANVRILAWNRRKRDLPKSMRVEDGARVEHFTLTAPPRSAGIVLVSILFEFWIFFRLLFMRFDAVQACDIFCALPAAIVCRLTGRKMIYDIRDPWAVSLKYPNIINKAVYAVDWCAMGMAHAFVVPTSRYISYMGRWGKTKPVLEIPNTCHDWLDRLPSLEGRLAPKRPGYVRLAYLGYLVNGRGGDWLLEFVSDDANKTELVVAGDSGRAEIQERLRQTPNVHYLGHVPYAEALAAMHESDATTLLYDPDHEINRILDPTKFYDAMMLGRPVIASRGMSRSSTVEEHGLGYAVPHGSDAALREAIESLRDEAEVEEMRTRCREYYLRHYPLDQFIGNYRDFYRRLAG